MVSEIIVGELIKDLFVNGCILIAFLFLSSRIFLRTGIGSKSTLRIKILAGVVGATLGITLMFFSIKIPPYSIVDLRNTAMMVVAIYAGGVATLITGIMIALFRFLYMGISSASAISALTALAFTAFLIIITKTNLSRRNKWIYMYFISAILATGGFLLSNKIPDILAHIIPAYWVGTLIATIVAYIVTEYLYKINTLFLNLAEQSSTDFLTGLKNTRSFYATYNMVLKNALKNNESFSVLMLDIDFFKHVNDEYGHAAGDIVLKELAELLIGSIRGFDIAARIGGEEFCIVLRNCSKDQALDIAERIRRTVEKHAFYLSEETAINVTISIGCAVYPDTIREINNVKEAADMKLYEAKRTGRNKVCS